MEKKESRVKRSKILMDSLLNTEKLDLPSKTIKLKAPFCVYKSRKYGYKNNKKFVVYVSSIKKGGIEPKTDMKKRNPGTLNKRFSRNVSLKRICTERLLKKHKNLKELQSYILKKDHKRVWFQHILFKPKELFYKKNPNIQQKLQEIG